MSRLELLIKQCRKVWKEMGVPVKIRDEMIDTLVSIDYDEETHTYKRTYAYEKITNDGIKEATEEYISNRKEDWDILKL
jgi:hypothetical protein